MLAGLAAVFNEPVTGHARRRLGYWTGHGNVHCGSPWSDRPNQKPRLRLFSGGCSTPPVLCQYLDPVLRRITWHPQAFFFFFPPLLLNSRHHTSILPGLPRHPPLSFPVPLRHSTPHRQDFNSFCSLSTSLGRLHGSKIGCEDKTHAREGTCRATSLRTRLGLAGFDRTSGLAALAMEGRHVISTRQPR